MTGDAPAGGGKSTASLAKVNAERFLASLASGKLQDPRADLPAFLAGLSDSVRDECRAIIEDALRSGEAGSGRPASAPPVSHGAAAVRSPDPPAGALPWIPGLRIEGKIGAGALGSVYAAWDERLERRVALKLLRRAPGEDVRPRVLDEARKAAGLRDPSIVTIHSVIDAGERQGGEGDSAPPAIVMELVDGYPIDRAVHALNWRQRARVLLKVIRGLAVAHARGIIHRDIKPANILVTPGLQPKILDFGLAIPAQAGGRQAGAFAGTPLYASPEQALFRPITTASDVFSFGSVMYLVLSGRAPFEAATAMEALERVASADPPFPRTINPRVPEDLQAICLACLSRDPAARPSAADVAADLRRYLAGEPARLHPALYRDLLQGRAAAHLEEVRDWEHQGIVSRVEADCLATVYRRLITHEDHWIVDARRLSLPQTGLYIGSWITLVASALLVWLCRPDLPAPLRWLLPALTFAVLSAAGIAMQARREAVAAASFLAAAVLGAVPAALSFLVEWGVLSGRPPAVRQLLEPPFANAQLLAASGAALALSLAVLGLLRLTAFAWTTAALAISTYLAFLLTRGWLDRKPEEAALWCLPLVALEVPALLFERGRRVRWALPFHLASLATLVVCLDVMAAEGPTTRMPGLRLVDAAAPHALLREQCLSFVLNGMLFLGLVLLLERLKSLDLRRGARILEVLVPVHILAALYVNARRPEAGLGDALIYLAAVLGILALGPWRSRRPFLLTGLVGIALGSHLLLERELVPRLALTLGLGILGLSLALAISLRVGRRGGEGRASETGGARTRAARGSAATATEERERLGSGPTGDGQAPRSVH